MFSKYKIIINIVISAIIFFFSWNIHAKTLSTPTIKNIYFQGLQHISIGEAILNASIKIGEKIDKKKISQIFQLLYSTKYFKTIKISYNTNTLFIDVKEYPIITKIAFIGNKEITNNTLQKHLNHQNIKIGKLLNENNLYKIKNNIKKLYYSIGKHNISIETVITHLPHNHIYIQWKINEGVWTKIKNIYFIGNQSFHYKKLISYFQKKSTYTLFPPKTYNIYDKKILIHNLKYLQSFYLNNGYINFKINNIKEKLTNNKEYISICINITEGKQYNISYIQLYYNNIPKQLSKTIKKTLQIKKNIPYHYISIKNIQKKLSELLSNYGYLSPQINTKLKINHIKNTINPHILVNLGNKFYVNKIFLQGNKNTKDSIILREIQQEEGKYVNMQLIHQGKKNLSYLGYFDTIAIKIQHIKNSNNLVNIFYQIQEKDMGIFRTGLGYDKKNKLNFQINIEKNNWLGIGNTIFWQGKQKKQQYYYELSLIHPYYKQKKNIINFYNKIFCQKHINTKKTNSQKYNIQNYGTDIIWNFPINTHKHYFNAQLEYDHYNIQSPICTDKNKIIYTKNTKKIQKHFILNNIYQDTNDILLTLHWNYNNLDNNIFPKIGNDNHIIGKFLMPIETYNYNNIIFSSNNFVPIWKNMHWVLMEKIQLEYSKITHSKKIPFYNCNNIETPHEIRCLYNLNKDENILFPYTKHNNYYNKKIQNTHDIKQNIWFTSNSELIIPTELFLHKKYSNIIRFALFFDIQKIWNINWKNTINKKNIIHNNTVRISSGIDIKWISPFGPITFSYGYPIKKCLHDKIEKFQFSIGKTW
ncbi:MAG: outer membrane protein assembly factor BamA [Candidatus Westeberhardia cardiocondylae]|nr:outer membrane protein assembly factor BamA [Candidatus Westeberhardia cardiocondylae]